MYLTVDLPQHEDESFSAYIIRVTEWFDTFKDGYFSKLQICMSIIQSLNDHTRAYFNSIGLGDFSGQPVDKILEFFYWFARESGKPHSSLMDPKCDNVETVDVNDEPILDKGVFIDYGFDIELDYATLEGVFIDTATGNWSYFLPSNVACHIRFDKLKRCLTMVLYVYSFSGCYLCAFLSHARIFDQLLRALSCYAVFL